MIPRDLMSPAETPKHGARQHGLVSLDEGLVLIGEGPPPEITSRHVTALCRLDLWHETREMITSRSSRPYAA
jgi:hypothetical protein